LGGSRKVGRTFPKRRGEKGRTSFGLFLVQSTIRSAREVLTYGTKRVDQKGETDRNKEMRKSSNEDLKANTTKGESTKITDNS